MKSPLAPLFLRGGANTATTATASSFEKSGLRDCLNHRHALRQSVPTSPFAKGGLRGIYFCLLGYQLFGDEMDTLLDEMNAVLAA